MIVLNLPQGWTGPKMVDGLQVPGVFRSHQVPLSNHHHYQRSANQGFFWFALDIRYLILRVLGLLRLFWDLRKPGVKVLAFRLIQRRQSPTVKEVAA